MSTCRSTVAPNSSWGHAFGLQRATYLPALVPGATLLVLRKVEGQHAGQDEHVVLPRGDVHAVGVGQAEPALGHGGDHLVAARDGVLVLEQIPGHAQVVGPGDVDGEAVHEGTEELLAHFGHLLALARDLVGRAQRRQVAPDLGYLGPRQIAHDERVVQGQDLAIDVIDGLALLVGNVGVLAQAEKPLADHVAHWSASLSIPLPPPYSTRDRAGRRAQRSEMEQGSPCSSWS